MTPHIDRLRTRYPHLAFHRSWRFDEATVYRLGECAALVAAITDVPLPRPVHDELLKVSLLKGAQATTAIEGNTLSDEEIARISSGESLPASQEYQEREVRNLLSALNDLMHEVVVNDDGPLVSPELLLDLHRKIGQELGDGFRAVPGSFARSSRVVGPYRAPAAEDVPNLVAQLCDWLRAEFHYPQQSFAQAVVQAIVTHLYIEWIHPFDDGNGRTGRLVEFYILLRAGLPSVASHILSNHYNTSRSEYYRQIQVAYQQRNLSGFIAFAVLGLRTGLRRTLATVQEGLLAQSWKVEVYERFAAKPIKQVGTHNRQRSLALHFPLDRAVPLLEIPQLHADLSQAYLGKSLSTIHRDVAELEHLDLVRRNAGLVEANWGLLFVKSASRRETPVASTSEWP